MTFANFSSPESAQATLKQCAEDALADNAPRAWFSDRSNDTGLGRCTKVSEDDAKKPILSSDFRAIRLEGECEAALIPYKRKDILDLIVAGPQ